MKYKLKVYSIWEFGQRKDAQGNPHQEDSLYPAFGKQTDDDRTFILCDGMGGHDAGEVASETVCTAMAESIRNDGHDQEGDFTDADLLNAINAAFDALDKVDNGAPKKMGTTMTFLKLHNLGATVAHMGDSRVYHIRPGKTGADTLILHQTEDHSLVNDLVKIGELTPEEARTSRQRNVITRAMQPHMERRPKADIFKTADIAAGDYFYLCSDGMLEDADMDEGSPLKNIFSLQGGDDEQKVEILKKVTKNNRDNHTAFIVHILDVEGPFPEPEALTETKSEQASAPEHLPEAVDEAIVEDGSDSDEDITITRMPGAPAPNKKKKEDTTSVPPLFNEDKAPAAKPATEKPAPASKPADKPAQASTAASQTTSVPTRRPNTKEDTATPTAAPQAQKSSKSSMILITMIIVFLLAIAGIFFFKQCSKPSIATSVENFNPGQIQGSEQSQSQTNSHHQANGNQQTNASANSGGSRPGNGDRRQNGNGGATSVQTTTTSVTQATEQGTTSSNTVGQTTGGVPQSITAINNENGNDSGAVVVSDQSNAGQIIGSNSNNNNRASKK